MKAILLSLVVSFLILTPDQAWSKGFETEGLENNPLSQLSQVDPGLATDREFLALIAEEESIFALLRGRERPSDLGPALGRTNDWLGQWINPLDNSVRFKALRDALGEGKWNGVNIPSMQSPYQGELVQALLFHRDAQLRFDEYQKKKVSFIVKRFYLYFQSNLSMILANAKYPAEVFRQSEIAKKKYAEFLENEKYFLTEDDWIPRRKIREFFDALDEVNKIYGTPFLTKGRDFISGTTLKGAVGLAKFLAKDPNSDLFALVKFFLDAEMSLDGVQVRIENERVFEELRFGSRRNNQINFVILPHNGKHLDALAAAHLAVPGTAIITAVDAWADEFGLRPIDRERLRVHRQIMSVAGGDSLNLLRPRLESGEIKTLVLLAEGNIPSGVGMEARPYRKGAISIMIKKMNQWGFGVDVFPVSTPNNFRLRNDRHYALSDDLLDMRMVFHAPIRHGLVQYLFATEKRDVHLLDTLARALQLNRNQSEFPNRQFGALPIQRNFHELLKYTYGGDACRLLIANQRVWVPNE